MTGQKTQVGEGGEESARSFQGAEFSSGAWRELRPESSREPLASGLKFESHFEATGKT